MARFTKNFDVDYTVVRYEGDDEVEIPCVVNLLVTVDTWWNKAKRELEWTVEEAEIEECVRKVTFDEVEPDSDAMGIAEYLTLDEIWESHQDAVYYG